MVTQDEKKEADIEASLQIRAEFKQKVPDEFKEDPFGVFERDGESIRPGEIQRDEGGNITDDPTATRLMDWGYKPDNTVYRVVGKMVNTSKTPGLIANPFHEYEIMELAEEFGLPCARPIAKITKGNQHLIVMEYVEGFNAWTDRLSLLTGAGFTLPQIDQLKTDADFMRQQVADAYEAVGIHNPLYAWKDENWVYQVDFTSKKLTKCIPVDWERAEINPELVRLARFHRDHPNG